MLTLVATVQELCSTIGLAPRSNPRYHLCAQPLFSACFSVRLHLLRMPSVRVHTPLTRIHQKLQSHPKANPQETSLSMFAATLARMGRTYPHMTEAHRVRQILPREP